VKGSRAFAYFNLPYHFSYHEALILLWSSQNTHSVKYVHDLTISTTVIYRVSRVTCWCGHVVYRVVRLIGPLVLVAGLTLLVVGIVAFVHLKNKLPQTSVANVVSQFTFFC